MFAEVAWQGGSSAAWQGLLSEHLVNLGYVAVETFVGPTATDDPDVAVLSRQWQRRVADSILIQATHDSLNWAPRGPVETKSVI